MQQTFQFERKDDRRKSLLLSILFHTILILLLLLPSLTYFNSSKPPEYQGITVFPVEINEIEDEELKEIKAGSKSVVSPPPSSAKKNVAPPVAEAKSKQVQSNPTKQYSKNSEEESPIVNARNDQKVKDESHAIPETKISEEELAAKKAEEKRREKENAKSRFGSLFDNSNDQSTAEVGEPLGRPDASVLDNLTQAHGQTGEGLSDRGIVFQPEISDQSQKTGRVVVRICVDKSGKVTNARYTQKGSSTTDNHLISLAEKSARQYRFSKGEIDEQCGNIIIDFRLQ